MKVVAINGSPRKNGNTKLLLEAVLQPLCDAGWQAELIQVGGLPIQGCRACGNVLKNKTSAVFLKMIFATRLWPKCLPPTP